MGENINGMEIVVNELVYVDLKYSKPKALSETAENPPFEEDNMNISPQKSNIL